MEAWADDCDPLPGAVCCRPRREYRRIRFGPMLVPAWAEAFNATPALSLPPGEDITAQRMRRSGRSRPFGRSFQVQTVVSPSHLKAGRRPAPQGAVFSSVWCWSGLAMAGRPRRSSGSRVVLAMNRLVMVWWRSTLISATLVAVSQPSASGAEECGFELDELSGRRLLGKGLSCRGSGTDTAAVSSSPMMGLKLAEDRTWRSFSDSHWGRRWSRWSASSGSGDHRYGDDTVPSTVDQGSG